jgi:hypothetical protein
MKHRSSASRSSDSSLDRTNPQRPPFHSSADDHNHRGLSSLRNARRFRERKQWRNWPPRPGSQRRLTVSRRDRSGKQLRWDAPHARRLQYITCHRFCQRLIDELKGLRYLRLTDAPVQSSDLLSLATLDRLEKLELSNTPVTELQANDLVRTFPRCRIYLNDKMLSLGSDGQVIVVSPPPSWW